MLAIWADYLSCFCLDDRWPQSLCRVYNTPSWSQFVISLPILFHLFPQVCGIISLSMSLLSRFLYQIFSIYKCLSWIAFSSFFLVILYSRFPDYHVGIWCMKYCTEIVSQNRLRSSFCNKSMNFNKYNVYNGLWLAENTFGLFDTEILDFKWVECHKPGPISFIHCSLDNNSNRDNNRCVHHRNYQTFSTPNFEYYALLLKETSCFEPSHLNRVEKGQRPDQVVWGKIGFSLIIFKLELIHHGNW